MGVVPELPEVEITARLLSAALAGRTIESALAPGINALKTFAPPLSSLEGLDIEAVGRRGKHLTIRTSGGLTLLMHLMSAGRLQLYDKLASPRDRTSRLLLRIAPAGEGEPKLELRLREFGSKQAAWVKLLADEELAIDEALAKLGPEAWPDPGGAAQLKELLDAPRPLHTQLRDQHVIAGIGRSWVDEILWRAMLSPYKRGADLSEDEAKALREAIVQTLGGAIERYEAELSLPLPDKLPLPLQIHRHEGQPCPRCGTELKAVHFEDYVIAYCPTCQTEGRTLKDRRMSRLLR
jgi:formamidopyrimidine-DNA glycosylase